MMMDEHKRMVREGLRFVGEQAVQCAELRRKVQDTGLRLKASKEEVERLRVALMKAEAQRVEEAGRADRGNDRIVELLEEKHGSPATEDNPETGGPFGLEWGDLQSHRDMDARVAHVEEDSAELRAELSELLESRRGLYARIDGLEAHVKEKDGILGSMRMMGQADAVTIARLEEDKKGLRADLAARDNAVVELEESVKTLRGLLQMRQNTDDLVKKAHDERDQALEEAKRLRRRLVDAGYGDAAGPDACREGQVHPSMESGE